MRIRTGRIPGLSLALLKLAGPMPVLAQLTHSILSICSMAESQMDCLIISLPKLVINIYTSLFFLASISVNKNNESGGIGVGGWIYVLVVNIVI